VWTIGSFLAGETLRFLTFRSSSVSISPMESKNNPIMEIAKDPQIYEVGYHIVPLVGEDNLGARVTAIRDMIETRKGVIISDEFPKSVDLAYSMVKIAENKRATHASSYFGWFKFQADPSVIGAIETDLKADNNLLRFMLVKTVRESTMSPKKPLRPTREEGREDGPREAAPVMSEAEMDKTIDDLVVAVAE
jgi:ribosomal protein S6